MLTTQPDPLPPPPPVTHWINTVHTPVHIHIGKGEGGRWTSEKVRGALVHKTGGNTNTTDCISSLKLYKTPVKTTYTVCCLYSYLLHWLGAWLSPPGAPVPRQGCQLSARFIGPLYKIFTVDLNEKSSLLFPPNFIAYRLQNFLNFKNTLWTHFQLCRRNFGSFGNTESRRRLLC